MNYISTAIPKVYATPSTLHLVNQYLSCPAAKKLIFSAAIFKPIFIQESTQEFGYTDIAFNNANGKPREVVISIPKHNEMENLIFEIFNAKIDRIHSQSRTVKEAKAGNLSMDQFARSLEMDELSHTDEHAALSRECRMFDLPYRANKEMQDQSVEMALFALDIECHTDTYRADWLANYRNIYCSKHPEDANSCTTKESDLCDRNQLVALQRDKYEKILKDRICMKYPQAHEDGRRLYRQFFEKNCPKKPVDSSKKTDGREL